MFKKSRKSHGSFGTSCTESIHHAFHHFETYELRGDPRVDIPESYLGRSHCIQNKQFMVQDIIEIFKYQIQTRAHQNGIHM